MMKTGAVVLGAALLGTSDALLTKMNAPKVTKNCPESVTEECGLAPKKLSLLKNLKNSRTCLKELDTSKLSLKCKAAIKVVNKGNAKGGKGGKKGKGKKGKKGKNGKKGKRGKDKKAGGKGKKADVVDPCEPCKTAEACYEPEACESVTMLDGSPSWAGMYSGCKDSVMCYEQCFKGAFDGCPAKEEYVVEYDENGQVLWEDACVTDMSACAFSAADSGKAGDMNHITKCVFTEFENKRASRNCNKALAAIEAAQPKKVEWYTPCSDFIMTCPGISPKTSASHRGEAFKCLTEEYHEYEEGSATEMTDECMEAIVARSQQELDKAKKAVEEIDTNWQKICTDSGDIEAHCPNSGEDELTLLNCMVEFHVYGAEMNPICVEALKRRTAEDVTEEDKRNFEFQAKGIAKILRDAGPLCASIQCVLPEEESTNMEEWIMLRACFGDTASSEVDPKCLETISPLIGALPSSPPVVCEYAKPKSRDELTKTTTQAQDFIARIAPHAAKCPGIINRIGCSIAAIANPAQPYTTSQFVSFMECFSCLGADDISVECQQAIIPQR